MTQKQGGGFCDVGGILQPVQLCVTECGCSALRFHAAHFEKLHFQLSKEFELDHMTGLLLIYPSCVLHIVEVSLLQMNPPESIQRLIGWLVVSPTVIQRGSTSCPERCEKPPATSKLVCYEDIAPTSGSKSVV